jgi:hypothetical protein
MPPAEFVPAIPASNQPQTPVLDHSTTRINMHNIIWSHEEICHLYTHLLVEMALEGGKNKVS